MAGKQKNAELSAGLLAVKGSAVPASDMAPRAVEVPEPAVVEPEAAPEAVSAEPRASTPEPEGDRNDAPLNFRVSPAFRREFRIYAAQNDLKLNELLRLAFDAYKARAS